MSKYLSQTHWLWFAILGTFGVIGMVMVYGYDFEQAKNCEILIESHRVSYVDAYDVSDYNLKEELDRYWNLPTYECENYWYQKLIIKSIQVERENKYE